MTVDIEIIIYAQGDREDPITDTDSLREDLFSFLDERGWGMTEMRAEVRFRG